MLSQFANANTIGRGFDISYETAKSSSVALFRLGERAYDHVIFFPTKAKGKPVSPSVLFLSLVRCCY